MIQLSHIGEELIAQMLSDSEAVRNAVCGGYVSTSQACTFVPELRLNNCGAFGFDGVHKIDVAVQNPETGICYPIEAKLGFDRLSKNEFEKRFLGECGTSHGNSRVKGSMIAILERKLPQACRGQGLSVSWEGREFCVSTSWVLVARKAVIEKWKESQAPRLSNNCHVIEFESLVSAYGSDSEFNFLVGRLINIDYFTEWQCST